MFSVILLVIFTIIVYFKLYGRHFKDFPVHPGHLPFIGHIHLLFGDEINLYNQMMKIADYNLLKKGRTVLKVGWQSYYDPEDCEILNSSRTEKHWIYSFTKDWLGGGLATASSSRWARTHKLLYPMFSSKLINGYLPVFNKQARRLMELFAASEGKGAFNHEKTIMLVGFETTCQTVFGDEVANNTAQEYDKAIIGIMNLCVERAMAPWFYKDFLFQLLSPLKRKQDALMNIINQFTDKFIEKNKARISNDTMEEKYIGKYRPFIDSVVKVALENNFSQDEIRHEISTLLFTGYKSSSEVLVYAMMLLGQYTDVQNKAYEELKEVFGDSERDVEKSDFSKLLYLEAILKETLRYLPIVPVLGRINNVDLKLKKVTLPAGSNIILNLHSLLRHPAWGPNADQFVPERWLDPATLPVNPNFYAAFGLGKRNCIGKEHAMMSMKTTLVHLLRRFKISSDMSNLVVKMELIAKSASGQHIILESRNVLSAVRFFTEGSCTNDASEYNIALGQRTVRLAREVSQAIVQRVMASYTLDLYNQIKKVGVYNVLKHGGRTRLEMGWQSFYIFSDPEDCDILMNSYQTEKHWLYSFTKAWLGEGLGTASSSRWARTHKLLYPMFSRKLINGYLPVFNKQARRLVDIFADKEGKGAFNHEQTVMVIGFETICQTVFGDEVSNNTAKDYDRAIIGIMNICVERAKAPWFFSDFVFQLTSLKKKHDEHMKIINQFTDKYIEKQKARINNNTMEDAHLGEYRPFIDSVVKVALENNFSHDQIRHEISTLLFTGYETSSVVMVYAMMLLGQHTDVQNKAYNELQEVFGESNRDVEKSDIPKLVYLEAILKETLRYSPVIPILGRTNNVDFKLKKFTLPAGSNIILNVYSLLRHPAWGPDSEQFVPERWLDPATLPANANLFAAFGIGKRNCIGKEYAMMSMKTTLVHLLRRYKISSDMSNLVIKMEILAKPASGQHIILESRNV